MTGIDAETPVRQLALEDKFLDQVVTNSHAARTSNDLKLVIAHRAVRRALFRHDQSR